MFEIHGIETPIQILKPDLPRLGAPGATAQVQGRDFTETLGSWLGICRPQRSSITSADTILPESRDALRANEPRIGAALRFVEANLQRSISNGDIASRVGLSLSRFSHLFHAETGSTPARMLMRMRLTMAADLLSSSRLPSKDISSRVGFRCHSAFARTFRAWSGVTPSQFRRIGRSSPLGAAQVDES
jgi:AraC family transcriptional regulator of arabinose operon